MQLKEPAESRKHTSWDRPTSSIACGQVFQLLTKSRCSNIRPGGAVAEVAPVVRRWWIGACRLQIQPETRSVKAVKGKRTRAPDIWFTADDKLYAAI